MKKLFTLTGIILLIAILAGCGQKGPKLPFAKESEQYSFFKTVSDSLGIKALDPDKAVKLVTSNDFTIWSYDIMPGIFSAFGRFKDNISSIPVDRLKSYLEQGANGEAEKKLLYAKAIKEGISVSDSTVNTQMEKFFQSRGGKEKFVEFIEQQGFDLPYVENDVRMSMHIQEFIKNKVETDLAISDEELEKAYNEPKTASVRHILFMTQGKTDEEKQEVKGKAEEILKRAKDGEDFAALAKEYSEDPGSKDNGGLYEDFGRGRMVKPFEDASFDLPIGSISDLVETQYGYHIIKVMDRKNETKPLDEVKTELEARLKQTKRQETYETMIEDLKSAANFQEHFDSI